MQDATTDSGALEGLLRDEPSAEAPPPWLGAGAFAARAAEAATDGADPEGLSALENEILELLNSPLVLDAEELPGSPSSPGHPPSVPPGAPHPFPSVTIDPAVWRGLLPEPGTRDNERVLKEEILRLRGALETIRSEIAEHKTVVAGVNGQLERVHAVLNEIKASGTRRTDISGAVATVPASPPSLTPAPPATAEAGNASRPFSAAPVFFMDPLGKEVSAQAFFTLGKGGALEHFLTDVLQDWEDSGYPIRAHAGKDGFTLSLQGDPEGRGLRLLPSGMYLMRLGKKEMDELQQLPPLVSSKVWPKTAKSGGFMRQA